MATNKGIECFPMSVDFFDDEKLALVEGEFGVKGTIIAIRLLCEIYREGYYCQWGNDERLLFARKSGANIVPTTVQEVVNGLVRRSFFDKRVYDQFKILTSPGIQQRYFEAVKRRKKVEVRRELLLVDVSRFSNVQIIETATSTPAAPAADAKAKKPAKTGRSVKDDTATRRNNDALADEIQELQSSPIWIEHVAMRFHLTTDKINQHLADFLADCRARGKKHDNIADAKRHFNDWLRIQIQLNQKQDGTKRKTSDKRRSIKDIAEKTEDFSATF